MNRTPPATLFAIATAAAAIGSLAHVSPAQAYPSVPLLPPNACAVSGYQFPKEHIIIGFAGIGGVRSEDTGAASTHVNVPATINYNNGSSLSGNLSGEVIGHGIDLTLTREGYPSLHLVGIVDSDNFGRGSYDVNGNTQPWVTADQLSCVPASSPEATILLKTATVVGGDANIYSIAHDENPDPSNGVRGMKIGTLSDGQQVTYVTGIPSAPCTPNSWCKIAMPGDLTHFGFVLGHLSL
jgi:hypothetical protein